MEISPTPPLNLPTPIQIPARSAEEQEVTAEQSRTSRLSCRESIREKLMTLSVADMGLSPQALIGILKNYKTQPTLNLEGLVSLTDSQLLEIVTICPQLQELSLDYCCELSFKGMNKALAKLPGLKLLSLRRTSANDKTLKLIGKNCHALENLSLASCAIGNKGLAYLPRSLTSVDLENCTAITHEGIKSFLLRVNGLEQLNLRFCQGLEDRTLELIGKQAPGLRQLDLRDCGRLTTLKNEGAQGRYSLRLFSDKAFGALLQQLPNLECLKASVPFGLSEETCLALNKLKTLRHLDLSAEQRNNLGHARFHALAETASEKLIRNTIRSLKGLRVLKLNLPLITPRTLSSIGRHLPLLRTLSFIHEGTKSVRSKQIETLSAGCLLLRDLNLNYVNYSSAFLLGLGGGLSKLQSLHLYGNDGSASKDSWEEFFATRENLKQLTLAGDGIDDACVQALCEPPMELEALQLCSPNLSIAAAEYLANGSCKPEKLALRPYAPRFPISLGEVRELQLAKLWQLPVLEQGSYTSQAGLSRIISAHPQLKALTIESEDFDQLSEISDFLPDLQQLHCGTNSVLLSPESLEELTLRVKGLRQLSLIIHPQRDTSTLTLQQWEALLPKMVQLERFCFGPIEEDLSEALERIGPQMPRLRQLHLSIQKNLTGTLAAYRQFPNLESCSITPVSRLPDYYLEGSRQWFSHLFGIIHNEAKHRNTRQGAFRNLTSQQIEHWRVLSKETPIWTSD